MKQRKSIFTPSLDRICARIATVTSGLRFWQKFSPRSNNEPDLNNFRLPVLLHYTVHFCMCKVFNRGCKRGSWEKNKQRERKGRIRTTKMHHPEHRPQSIHPRRPDDRVSKVCMMSVQRWCNFIDADGKGSDGSLKIVRNYPGARS